MGVCGGWGKAELRADVDWEKNEGLRLRVWAVERVAFDDIGALWTCVCSVRFFLLGSLNFLSTLIYRS